MRESLPDGSPGPRVFLAGCEEGNLVHVRRDMPDNVAVKIVALVAAEPPWSDPEAPPSCLPGLIELLSAERAAVQPSLIFDLPHDLPVAGPPIVSSGSDAGVALVQGLSRHGMPAHLVEAGFVGLDDLWAPWCAAMDDEEIAALCFAARLSDAGAAVGVYTFPRWRGRGFAAAVTAAWSGHPELADRTLGYSTLMSNTASQRVAARLGLRRIGLGLRIA